MNKWEAKIPKNLPSRDRKHCYTVWTRFLNSFRTGGKVVWLTNRELTFYQIKYPNKIFKEILEKDKLEEYKKYMDATVE